MPLLQALAQSSSKGKTNLITLKSDSQKESVTVYLGLREFCEFHKVQTCMMFSSKSWQKFYKPFKEMLSKCLKALIVKLKKN